LLTGECRAFLDRVLLADAGTGRTPLSWLCHRATSNSAGEILGAVDKLGFLREAGTDRWDLSALNPNRVKWLAQIGRRATNQYLQRTSEERRYPLLLVTLKQSLIDLTDEIIEMVDQCLWNGYSEARKDLETFHQTVARSVNDKLVLFREIGQVLLDPQVADGEVRPLSFRRVPPQLLQAAIEDTDRLIRPRHDGYYDFFARRYSYLRRFAPTLLETFTFHEVGVGYPAPWGCLLITFMDLGAAGRGRSRGLGRRAVASPARACASPRDRSVSYRSIPQVSPGHSRPTVWGVRSRGATTAPC